MTPTTRPDDPPADHPRVCLDLFAGLGGFSQAFRAHDDWTVATVDHDPDGRFDPDLRADVLDLRPADLVALVEAVAGVPFGDVGVLVVLASPPCTLLSTAGNHDEWDLQAREPAGERARDAVALLCHTLGLIHALAPDYWYLENPRRSRAAWVVGPPDAWVTYCQYGESYMKPTGLWGDHAPMDYRTCAPGDACHDSSLDENGNSDNWWANAVPTDPAKRAKVPRELSAAIRQAVDDALADPPPEQATLADAVGGDR